MNRIEFLREVAEALNDVSDSDLRMVDRKLVRDNILSLTAIRELREQCRRQAETIMKLECGRD